ncbi:DUF4440 domain-containing protein [Sphingomonas sp. SM33]|uniref:DUF4440 domain-containing protein n=1 Tax=Sphingomonas telluris TaxID=2907998 RepID=A0ABS9VK96_9SPHN|nr:DUF4440 domain-containing protein [Sphingomonas telluris]MCH8614979.1 DUF4440 domain-containing protein [Sphingomonas telluris]
MIIKTATALALVTMALSGCNKEAPAKVDTAAIEQQIRDNEGKWQQSYNAHDAKALAANYAADAALANPGEPLITGTEGINKTTAGFASDPNLKVEFAADRVQVAASGDLAYTRGHYTMTTTDPETRKPVEGAGSYLTVYKKQTDGSWKAVEDFITPGPAPAAAK